LNLKFTKHKNFNFSKETNKMSYPINENAMNEQTMVSNKIEQLPQLPNNLKTLALNKDFNHIWKKYNSDTGNRDSGSEKTYEKSKTFDFVLSEAIKLRANLIVKTSYISEKRPGAWYIKWLMEKRDPDELEEIILENIEKGKHSKRECYLIRYN
jgi:hypothetical protein